MHKKISSRLAVEIVLLLSILVGGYTLIFSGVFEEQTYTNNVALTGKNIKAPAAASDLCTAHVYEGAAEVRGWYIGSGDEWLLAISDEDLKKLPNYDGTEEFKLKNKQVKLVDAAPAVEKKLKSTSEKKPQAITITGYASRCQSVPLVSLKYKDGIFEQFLDS
jgi:hypothetical protein